MKKPVILLIAAIIATICFVYVVSYMNKTSESVDTQSGTEALGTSIAMALATPSVVVSGFGTLFAWLGYLLCKKGFALTAGILFAVAMVLMIPWFMFNVVQMILCFVAYAKMK